MTDEELSALKTRREIEKLEIEITNAKSYRSLERFKAWAALLGPIMTAATVLGTVYIAYLQLSAKSQSDEDTNWRQTLSSIDETKPEHLQERHVGTLLKPFLESNRYRTLAIGVTVDELPRLRDVGTFKDLFFSAFPQSEPKDLPSILEIARRLTAADTAANEQKSAAAVSRDERTVVTTQVALLCGPIADILRKFDHKTLTRYFAAGRNASSKIPLDSIYFERCDFSGIDFSDADIGNSVFDFVKLDGATLENVDDLRESLWAGNIWWRARYVGPDLLKALLAQYRPNMFTKFVQAYRDNEVIKQEDWERDIRRLCASAKLTCTDEQIRAEFPQAQ